MCETMEDAEHQTGNSSGRPITLGGSTATSKTGSDAQLLFALESLCGHVSLLFLAALNRVCYFSSNSIFLEPQFNLDSEYHWSLVF